MIEEIILNYLNNSEELGATVYMETPRTIPSEYFLLEKTGSAFSNHIYTSTFAIQSYAETLYDAALANEAIKELMLYGLNEEAEVVSVSLNSDYNYTNPTTKQYRYQAVFEVVHY